MVDWKNKLTSRKFWAAIASFVSMRAVALGAAEETGAQITALIMAGASVIAYIVGEGLADAAGALPEDINVYNNIIPEPEEKPPEPEQ